MADQYFQKWTAEVGTARKMTLYKMFKTELCMEKYLYLPPHLRTALTKLRASCHQLQIERGRYQCPPIPAHERFCQFCQNGSVEDEKHFLLQCPVYVNLSVYKEFVNTCREKISKFEALTTENKFIKIMSSQDPILLLCLAKFVYGAFKYRALIL